MAESRVCTWSQSRAGLGGQTPASIPEPPLGGALWERPGPEASAKTGGRLGCSSWATLLLVRSCCIPSEQVTGCRWEWVKKRHVKGTSVSKGVSGCSVQGLPGTLSSALVYREEFFPPGGAIGTHFELCTDRGGLWSLTGVGPLSASSQVCGENLLGSRGRQ